MQNKFAHIGHSDDIVDGCFDHNTWVNPQYTKEERIISKHTMQSKQLLIKICSL